MQKHFLIDWKPFDVIPFWEINQPIHSLEAHIDGSFAKKALLLSYGLSNRGLIFFYKINLHKVNTTQA